MLPILALILILASIALIVWQFYPAGARLVADFHAKRIKRDANVLNRMFLEVSKKKLALIYVLSPVVAGILGFVLTQSPMLAAAAVAFGLVLPTLALKIMEKTRNAKFCRQLVDGLMVLSSSLKGGLSLLQAIEVLVEEMPAPINQEFALVLRENKIGVPLGESLEKLNKRIKSEELNLIITAIDIARETGGNLTEPFQKLMLTIRERDKLIGKVNTLTMQAKLQGVIMSFMPIVFGIAVYYLNPAFFKIMLQSQIGRSLLVAAGALELVGAYLLWKLSQVDV